MLLRLQGRKAGEYMRFEKPGYMLGFFVVGIKKRGGPFFCAIAMLKKDFRYIKINKKIPQKSAE
jgi:hypothetical protein